MVLKKGPKIIISAQPDWILENLTKIIGLISNIWTMANDYGKTHFWEMFPMNYAKNNAISKMSKLKFVIDNLKAVVFADQTDNTLCRCPLTHSMPLTATTYDPNIIRHRK